MKNKEICMKKKIMSFVCALVMIIAAAEPAFAADSETKYSSLVNCPKRIRAGVSSARPFIEPCPCITISP